MSTSYYLIPNIDNKLMISTIGYEGWRHIKSLIPEKIHIGTFAAGAFAFNEHYWQYFKPGNIDYVKDFTRRFIIVDEYGRYHSDDDFWAMVEKYSADKEPPFYKLDGFWFGSQD